MKNCLLCIALLLASEAFGGRTISVPYIVRRTYLTYPPEGGLVPRKLGAVQTAIVTVKNVSNTTQNVTVRHATGSYAYSSTSELDVCLGLTGSNNKVISSNGLAKAPLFNVVDVSRTLEISPNNLQQFILYAAYTSKDSYSGRSWSILFIPSIEVEVREDKGAVVATISMHSESCPGLAGQNCNCDNTAIPSNFGTEASLNLADPVMMINGGRPF